MTEPLTEVSLFAGVGGFGLALERCGVRSVAAVEIDKDARGVLARRFPESKIFDDVRTVTGADLRAAGFVPERGILSGGFPCQDLSVAGKRAGLAGARSGLFWEITRLADELQPKWLLLENVPGLLSSHGGRDFGTVLGALVERGYGIGYRILDAQYYGVPQRRKRVFIVGCLGDDGRAPAEVLALAEGLRGDRASSGAPREGVAAAAEGGAGERRIVPALTSKMAKGTGGLSGDECQNLVPFVKGKRAQTVDDDESWREGDVTPTLNAFDQGDTRATTVVAYTFDTRGREGGSATEMGPPDVATALRAGDGSSSRGKGVLTEMGVRRLTPLEAERLQGFPDGWTEGQSDNRRYRQMGNAVAVPCVQWIGERLVAVDAEQRS